MLKRLLCLLLLCVLGVTLTAQDSTPIPDADIAVMLKRLHDTPTYINFSTDTVKEIYARGQKLGNRAPVFTTLGDSDTAQGAFLRPMGMGTHPGFYCDLGDHSDLQAALDFYSSVPPKTGISNSFNNTSLTAHQAFSAVTMFDPWWAESQSAECKVGETPIDCEYRLVQPASAIVMFGLIDVQFFSVDEYKANMGQIIQHSIDAGVIPILSTFVVLEENPKQDWRTSIVFDNALLDLSEEYQVPLINLWREVQVLPKKGISADGAHLGYPASGFCDFTGAQETYGGVLRNFLTLTALDMLRREVFEPDAPMPTPSG